MTICGRVSGTLGFLSAILSLASLAIFFSSADFNLIHLALFTLFAFAGMLFELTYAETRGYEAKSSKGQAIDFSAVLPISSPKIKPTPQSVVPKAELP